jgi:hypothetical protein
MPKQLCISKEDQYEDAIGYYDTKGDYWQLRFFDVIWHNLSKDFTKLNTDILRKMYYKIYDTDALNLTREELLEKVSSHVTFM